MLIDSTQGGLSACSRDYHNFFFDETSTMALILLNLDAFKSEYQITKANTYINDSYVPVTRSADKFVIMRCLANIVIEQLQCTEDVNEASLEKRN